MTHFMLRGSWSRLLLSVLVVSTFPQPAWSDEATLLVDVDAPAVSPDGGLIAFVSDASGSRTIWISARDGSNAHPLVDWPQSTQTEPDWSPDGRQVVFVSNRQSTNRNIWSVDATGANAARLTVNAGDHSSPKYSPDGTKILFSSTRSGGQAFWYMAADGSNQRASALPLDIAEPSWSPDGSALVYSKCEDLPSGSSLQDMVCHLFTYKIDTGLVKQLTFEAVQDGSPDWGPSGIVFSSSSNNSDSIWIVNETGANPNRRQLTASPGFAGNPRWARATNTVVFAKTKRTSDIWETTLSGEEQQLTRMPALNQSSAPK